MLLDLTDTEADRSRPPAPVDTSVSHEVIAALPFSSLVSPVLLLDWLDSLEYGDARLCREERFTLNAGGALFAPDHIAADGGAVN